MLIKSEIVYPEINPYSPGSGLRPPELAGRQAEIDAFDLTIARTLKSAPSRSMVLHGLRGVGKTVLLNRFREMATRAGWFTVELEGAPTDGGRAASRQRLARGLLVAARRLNRLGAAGDAVKAALGSIASFGLSVGGASISIGVNPTAGRADSGEIDVDLLELVEDLAPALRSQNIAFGLFVDEMQDLDDDLLTALLGAQHRSGQEGFPFFVVGAGLPSLPALLSTARSYAERLFDYRSIGSLDEGMAREALVTPATRLGMTYSPKAAQAILDASEGYPYFIQTFGARTWDLAQGRVISHDEALAGLDVGRAALDAGFYPARWDRATPAERRYLRAMAELGGDSVSTSAVAKKLGVTLNRLSASRQSLIEKGVVFAPERGLLAFTVPGMGAFLMRQSRDD